MPFHVLEVDRRDIDLFLKFKRAAASGFHRRFRSQNIDFSFKKRAIERGNDAGIFAGGLHQSFQTVFRIKHDEPPN